MDYTVIILTVSNKVATLLHACYSYQCIFLDGNMYLRFGCTTVFMILGNVIDSYDSICDVYVILRSYVQRKCT